MGKQLIFDWASTCWPRLSQPARYRSVRLLRMHIPAITEACPCSPKLFQLEESSETGEIECSMHIVAFNLSCHWPEQSFQSTGGGWDVNHPRSLGARWPQHCSNSESIELFSNTHFLQKSQEGGGPGNEQFTIFIAGGWARRLSSRVQVHMGSPDRMGPVRRETAWKCPCRGSLRR